MGRKLYRPVPASREREVQNIAIIAPFVFFSSLIVGTAFYSIFNSWNLDVSFYYATQVILGNMYGVPSEPNYWSPVFTLVLFVWGTSMIATAIGALISQIVTKTLKTIAEERREIVDYITQEQGDDQHYNSSNTNKAWLFFKGFLVTIGWFDHTSKYVTAIAAFAWYLVGILYGTLFERWDLSHSSFCALSAMAANGLCPPDASKDGTVNGTRAILYGTYILIGVPLFAFTMAQMVAVVVERMVRASEVQLMMRPLSETEYEYARKLRHGNGVSSSTSKANDTIDLGGFLVMELLRLKKIDTSDLELIKAVFDQIDEDKNGVLDLRELQSHSFVDMHSSEAEASTVVTEVASPVEKKGARRYNSLILPFITQIQHEAREASKRPSWSKSDAPLGFREYSARMYAPARKRSISLPPPRNEKSPLLPYHHYEQ